MKRRQNALEVEEIAEGSGEVKRSKLADSDSGSDSGDHSSTSSHKHSGNDEKSPKSATSKRSRASELDYSPRSSNTRSSGAKRTSAKSHSSTTSDKGDKSSSRRASRRSTSSTDKKDDLPPPLVNVPRYVDYYLLPGTTLTIHRKEFVTMELNHTAQAIATKLSTKVSRAIKKGTYTPRSQLPANAPLQRPFPLTSPATPLPDPLHPIALDLKTNRREPPRPKMLS